MSPNSGNHTAESKGVHREVKSEGSWWQISGLTNRNFTQGIPAMVDRLVQAINQVLTLIYEPQLSPNSYGSRPKCGCLDDIL